MGSRSHEVKQTERLEWNIQALNFNKLKNYQIFKKYTSSDRKKSTLRFFLSLWALQFWEMALLFYFYLGKFSLNIFPDLKSKQIKFIKLFKKLNLPTFLFFWPKKVCLHTFKTLISQKLSHQLSSNKLNVIMIR